MGRPKDQLTGEPAAVSIRWHHTLCQPVQITAEA